MYEDGTMYLLEITITNTFNRFTMPLLGVSIASGIIIYFAVTRWLVIKHQSKLRRVEQMIREGHEKALHGKRDDGIYKETKRGANDAIKV